jgi:hypothetical protein
LLAGAGNGQINWKQPITFSTLGPSIAQGMGADLHVDGDAAKNSAHITTEFFAPDACEIAEACVRAPGMRKLLRFDGDIQNLGTDDLVLGSPNDNPNFELSSCHHVNLLKNIMLYQLLDSAQNPVTVSGQDVVGRKTGFCMMDIAPVTATAADPKYNCDNQGITVGWEDIYDSALECQYLDITDVPSGDYTLHLTVNPDGAFAASNTGENEADVPIAIN